VLVDIDLTSELKWKVLVKRKRFTFFVELDYESMSDYCTHCKTIGHHVNKCRRIIVSENGKKLTRFHSQEELERNLLKSIFP